MKEKTMRIVIACLIGVGVLPLVDVVSIFDPELRFFPDNVILLTALYGLSGALLMAASVLLNRLNALQRDVGHAALGTAIGLLAVCVFILVLIYLDLPLGIYGLIVLLPIGLAIFGFFSTSCTFALRYSRPVGRVLLVLALILFPSSLLFGFVVGGFFVFTVLLSILCRAAALLFPKRGEDAAKKNDPVS